MNDIILYLFVPAYAAISSKVAQHRREEQQQVDALLASQKHLTSNLRTLINSESTAASAQQAQHTGSCRLVPFHLFCFFAPPPHTHTVTVSIHACEAQLLIRMEQAAVLQHQVQHANTPPLSFSPLS
jgi:hypothetical protein